MSVPQGPAELCHRTQERCILGFCLPRFDPLTRLTVKLLFCTVLWYNVLCMLHTHLCSGNPTVYMHTLPTSDNPDRTSLCLSVFCFCVFPMMHRLAGRYAGSSGQLQYHRQRTEIALQHAERRRRIVGKSLKMSENSCRALGLQGVVSFTAFGDRWAFSDL